MFHSRWIRKLLGVPRSPEKRRPAAQTRRPVPLILESLEERLTPSEGNPTVTQAAGGYTALTGLIKSDTADNTNYVIQITSSFTFTSGGQVSISKLGAGSTLTIKGQSGTNITLTGNGNRLFDIAAAQPVTLSNLTLTGGSGVTSGGALLDAGGSVTLSGVTVKTNTATGTAAAKASGGGVYVSATGSLSILNSLITKNSAIGGVAGQGASGGGVSITGASKVTITDSTLSDNKANGSAGAAGTKAGSVGGDGGSAMGGGVFASGSGWSVTLTGDTLSGNKATGGGGGAGMAGSNPAATNKTGGNGGAGGNAGSAMGGGLYASGSGTLTILNDTAAPLSHPSLFLGNLATAGAGGNGGAGGTSTGTAKNSFGGNGGNAGFAYGGAVQINASRTVAIGNTTFYSNTAVGASAGTGGAAGSGGSGVLGGGGITGTSGVAQGGGVSLSGSNTFTLVNSTLGKNTATATAALGGGFIDNDSMANGVTLDNNTITQNSLSGAGLGAGVLIQAGNPALFNNLIQGNSGGDDLTVSSGTTLSNASNNFIQNVNPPGAVSATTNITGKSTAQLGSVVGVGSGGPIYYPLLTGSLSIGAGTSSVLGTISSVVGTTPAVDAVGGLRTSNGQATGSISLGAAQPLAAGAPLATTLVAGNTSINYYDSNPSSAFSITAAVNAAAGGTAGGGSLLVYLDTASNRPLLLGMAIVSANGVATVNVPAGALPANLQAGKYDLLESYSGNASFNASNAMGTLNIAPAPTTIVPGNATVKPGSSSPFAIVVGVNSPNGTVNSGNVTISLVHGNTTMVVGSAGVSGGSANVPIAIPSGLGTGTYTLIESYTDSTGRFNGSSAAGTLTITSPTLSPFTAALELAVDTAALLLAGNPASLTKLQLFSEAFLHYSIPASMSALISEIQTLFPQSGDLGVFAIGAGIVFAQDLQ